MCARAQALPAAPQAATQRAFARAFGSAPPEPVAFPSARGLGIRANVAAPAAAPAAAAASRRRLQPATEGATAPAAEVNAFDVNCTAVEDFLRADAATWTPFLRAQLGFLDKLTLYDPYSFVDGGVPLCPPLFDASLVMRLPAS